MGSLLQVAELIRDIRVLTNQLNKVIGSQHILLRMFHPTPSILRFDLRPLLPTLPLMLLQLSLQLLGSRILLLICFRKFLLIVLYPIEQVAA